MPSLTIREPGQVAVSVALTGTCVIGRDEDCARQLRHTFPGLSWKESLAEALDEDPP